MIPGTQPGMSLFGGSLTPTSLTTGSMNTGVTNIASGGSSFASMFSELASTANGSQGTTSGQSVSGVGGAGFGIGPGIGSVSGLGATAATTPFADLTTESVRQVDKLERSARSSIEGLISGKGVDVHEAMIATEKAEMGFEMVISVRDKALAAYQQVMGMQF